MFEQVSLVVVVGGLTFIALCQIKLIFFPSLPPHFQSIFLSLPLSVTTSVTSLTHVIIAMIIMNHLRSPNFVITCYIFSGNINRILLKTTHNDSISSAVRYIGKKKLSKTECCNSTKNISIFFGSINKTGRIRPVNCASKFLTS